MAYGGTIATDMVHSGVVAALGESRKEYNAWYAAKNADTGLMNAAGLSRGDFCSTYIFFKQMIGGESKEEKELKVRAEKLGACWKRGRTRKEEGSALQSPRTVPVEVNASGAGLEAETLA
jgi:hypothetical protein